MKVNDDVLCNLKLSYDDKFNPWAVKGTIVSVFSTKDMQWAKVDWHMGHISLYRLDKNELIPFTAEELKKRKLDVKNRKKGEVPDIQESE